jgi:hypothetical protein
MYLFGLKDGSSITSVLPVADLMRSWGYSILLVADGVARDTLDKLDRPYLTGKNAKKFFSEHRWLRPKLVIAGTCSGGGISPLPLTEAAHAYGIPVLWVQDFAGNHQKQEFKERTFIKPDWVALPNECAKNLLLSSWQDFKEEHARITGQPAFDRLAAVDCMNARRELCAMLGLPINLPILYFAGQAWGTPEAMRILRDALAKISQPVSLVVRYHSRMLRSDAPKDFKEIYAACKEIEGGFGAFTPIDATIAVTGDIAMAGADIIMSMYSSVLFEAAYLRKAAVSIFPPEAAKALMQESTLSSFPPSDLGACFSASSAEELSKILHCIITEGNVLLPLQEAHYRNDGKNTERVARWILEIS